MPGHAVNCAVAHDRSLPAMPPVFIAATRRGNIPLATLRLLGLPLDPAVADVSVPLRPKVRPRFGTRRQGLPRVRAIPSHSLDSDAPPFRAVSTCQIASRHCSLCNLPCAGRSASLDRARSAQRTAPSAHSSWGRGAGQHTRSDAPLSDHVLPRLGTGPHAWFSSSTLVRPYLRLIE